MVLSQNNVHQTENLGVERGNHNGERLNLPRVILVLNQLIWMILKAAEGNKCPGVNRADYVGLGCIGRYKYSII